MPRQSVENVTSGSYQVTDLIMHELTVKDANTQLFIHISVLLNKMCILHLNKTMDHIMLFLFIKHLLNYIHKTSFNKFII